MYYKIKVNVKMYTFTRLPSEHWHVHKSTPVHRILRARGVGEGCWVYVAFVDTKKERKRNLLPDRSHSVIWGSESGGWQEACRAPLE